MSLPRQIFYRAQSTLVPQTMETGPIIFARIIRSEMRRAGSIAECGTSRLENNRANEQVSDRMVWYSTLQSHLLSIHYQIIYTTFTCTLYRFSISVKKKCKKNARKKKITQQKDKNLVQVQQQCSVYFCVKKIFKS